MGKNGTDVAKNASDMILADDNFVTIVKAVKQGRNIYDNIKKAIHFLIATNIGEIVTIFMGLIMGLKSPLLAIQLLWINFSNRFVASYRNWIRASRKRHYNAKTTSRQQKRNFCRWIME